MELCTHARAPHHGPISIKSRTQPVAKEFQIGLYNEFFVGGAAADEQEGAEYSRSPENPALQLLQKRSKSASAVS